MPRIPRTNMCERIGTVAFLELFARASNAISIALSHSSLESKSSFATSVQGRAANDPVPVLHTDAIDVAMSYLILNEFKDFSRSSACKSQTSLNSDTGNLGISLITRGSPAVTIKEDLSKPKNS